MHRPGEGAFRPIHRIAGSPRRGKIGREGASAALADKATLLVVIASACAGWAAMMSAKIKTALVR
jgi:hypothetical protein